MYICRCGRSASGFLYSSGFLTYCVRVCVWFERSKAITKVYVRFILLVWQKFALALFILLLVYVVKLECVSADHIVLDALLEVLHLCDYACWPEEEEGV